MNDFQKKVLLSTLGAFLISIIYVPEAFVSQYGQVTHQGWTLIWDLIDELNIKILVVEWVGILVIGGGLFFYFKSESKDQDKNTDIK